MLGARFPLCAAVKLFEQPRHVIRFDANAVILTSKVRLAGVVFTRTVTEPFSGVYLRAFSIRFIYRLMQERLVGFNGSRQVSGNFQVQGNILLAGA